MTTTKDPQYVIKDAIGRICTANNKSFTEEKPNPDSFVTKQKTSFVTPNNPDDPKTQRNEYSSRSSLQERVGESLMDRLKT